MTDKKTKSDKPGKNEEGWSTGAKVGAAVGSAALAAALLYAGRRHLSNRKGKLEPDSPDPKDKPDLSKQPKTDTD